MNPPGMDDQFWYIRYFQEEGRIEAELEKDLERSLRILYYGLCADAPAQSWMKQLEHPRSSGLLDALPEPKQLPSWLTPEDLDYYVEQYRTSGFRGPVNWYRNIPTNNGITPELEGKNFPSPRPLLPGRQTMSCSTIPTGAPRFRTRLKTCAFSKSLKAPAIGCRRKSRRKQPRVSCASYAACKTERLRQTTCRPPWPAQARAGRSTPLPSASRWRRPRNRISPSRAAASPRIR